MNKKIFGLAIPYYKNSEECEKAFKKLMEQLNKQLTEDMVLYVYEDGQFSNWLWEYAQKEPHNIHIISTAKNKGVSHARNVLLEKLINKVEYILFIDSDDMIDENYLEIMYEYCADMTHEVVEPTFQENKLVCNYNPQLIRCGVAGIAIKTSIIGNNRFDEKRQIAEDCDFSHKVIDLTKHRKRHAKTKYYYQLGINPNSLTMKYKRKEIGEMRNGK